MSEQVSVNVDLYGGATKAGKWYDIGWVGEGRDTFQFTDDAGEWMCCSVENCSHLEDYPDAFYSFREKASETEAAQMITPAEIEAVAREACKQMGLNPDQTGGPVFRNGRTEHVALWETFADDARKAIAFARAIEALAKEPERERV